MTQAILKQDMLKETLDKVQPVLKTALTDIFKGLIQEIYEVMDSLKEPRDQYHISIYPFSISRVDGNPVSQDLLRGIQARLQT